MFEVDSSQQALQHLSTLGDFMPSKPLYLGRARHKALTSIGHLVDRFLSASGNVRHAVLEESRWPQLLPLLDSMAEADSPELRGEGLFAVALGLRHHGWTLQPYLLPAVATETVLKTWHRVQPDAPHRLPAVLTPSALAFAPLWTALLHLQPLQRDWELSLRRSHLRLLTDLLPGAWLMDPSPLPPGAVIPGLELASWAELARFENDEGGRSRCFAITDAWGSPGSGTLLAPHHSWQSAVTAALAQPLENRQILMEIPPAPEGVLFALYEKKGPRTDYLGAVACRSDDADGWRVSRVA